MGKHQSLYDARWQKYRKGFLQRHRRCKMCGASATVVDHIKPHRGNWLLFWDVRNWQALCARCHNSVKQASESNEGKGCDAQGRPLDLNSDWYDGGGAV